MFLDGGAEAKFGVFEGRLRVVDQAVDGDGLDLGR